MRKIIYLSILSFLILFQLLGMGISYCDAADKLPDIDVSYCGTVDKKLELVFDLEKLGLLTAYKAQVSAGIKFRKRKPLIYVKKEKLIISYKRSFGEIKNIKIPTVSGKEQALFTFLYPAEGFTYLGADSSGTIWAIGKKSQHKIGKFAQRMVKDLSGKQRTLKMHRLNNSKFWCCEIDGRICVDKGDGQLQTIGYISWFQTYIDNKTLYLPMTRRLEFPAKWNGRIGKQIHNKESGTIEKMVQTAIKTHDLEALKVLISQKPGILKEMDKQASPPLLYIVLNSPSADEKYLLINFLIKNGCSANSANKSGAYPIHRAMDFQNYSLAELFLENGADPNQAKTGSKLTPLHIAAQGRMVIDEDGKFYRKSNLYLINSTFGFEIIRR